MEKVVAPWRYGESHLYAKFIEKALCRRSTGMSSREREKKVKFRRSEEISLCATGANDGEVNSLGLTGYHLSRVLILYIRRMSLKISLRRYYVVSLLHNIHTVCFSDMLVTVDCNILFPYYELNIEI